MYYKLEQACVTNWGSFVLLQIRASVVTSWGSYYKLGQPLLQTRAVITNWSNMYYKLGQVLQIRAIITNWGITRCCVIQISIMLLRLFLYLLYLCSCRGIGLIMSYLSDLLFTFISIFIMINRIISKKKKKGRHPCPFAYFLEYVLLFLDDIVDEERE